MFNVTSDCNDKPPGRGTEVLDSIGRSSDPHDGQCRAGDETAEQVDDVARGEEGGQEDGGDDEAGAHKHGGLAAEAVADEAADDRAEEETCYNEEEAFKMGGCLFGLPLIMIIWQYFY